MRMILTGSLCVVAVLQNAGTAAAVLPARKFDAEGAVEKLVPATDAEKKAGVLVIVFLKDRKDGVPITKATAVHRQMGKLVPLVEATDIKIGAKVSVWVDAKGAAEGVLIFP